MGGTHINKFCCAGEAESILHRKHRKSPEPCGSGDSLHQMARHEMARLDLLERRNGPGALLRGKAAAGAEAAVVGQIDRAGDAALQHNALTVALYGLQMA